jgi:predicted nucleic acid-binding protein
VPSRPLSEIPTGTDLFIDANVLIYGLNGKSAQCRELLIRCSREEITGVCLYEIANEATHRFMLAEARSKGLIRLENARELRNKPEVVKVLADYWPNVERILRLNILCIPLEEAIIRQACAERQAAGLLTNDSMIVASMRLYGVAYLASADSDFDPVSGITVFGPRDLP